MTQKLTITQPDDWHLHVRDGSALPSIVPLTAKLFGRAIIMPNLRPPVTTTALALAYRQRILDALPADTHFEPLMTLYLTDRTSAEEIRRAKESGVIHAIKLYPAGATTHSDEGVTDIRKCAPALEEMARLGIPLSIHGEVTDPEVDIFDREQVFIDQVLIPFRKDFPEVRIVFEHVSSKEAVEYVLSENAQVAATVTPHHLCFNRNALFQGGLHPHYFCLPILKGEVHRQAIIQAIQSGSTKFFAGTDSAPHPRQAKENTIGSAGCYNHPVALPLYAQVFEAHNMLHLLEAFLSESGPAFYGLPKNTQKLTLVKKAWQVPDALPFAEGTVVPLMAGEKLMWQVL